MTITVEIPEPTGARIAATARKRGNKEAERRGDPPAVHVFHMRNPAMLSPGSIGGAEGG